ncbi:Hypothetical protein, putative, partial [Bodo saltans]
KLDSLFCLFHGLQVSAYMATVEVDVPTTTVPTTTSPRAEEELATNALLDEDDGGDGSEPQSPVTFDDTVSALDLAAARELKKKADEKRRNTRRLLREQERRRARDAAEAKRKEMLALHRKQLVASSLQVLEFIKALFDLVEVLPREQVITDGKKPRD